MPNRNLSKIHLLETFQAILREGSVVEAGHILGLTQSAVSKHLSQLREWLDDPLFVRTSEGMQPTPRALELIPRVDRLLSDVALLTDNETPDPRQFKGVFTLSATDEILMRYLPALAAEFDLQTPNLTLKTMPLQPDYSLHQLETGQVNLLIAVNWHAPGQLKQRRLFQDEFVCVMRRDHPLANQELTLGNYASASHVLVAPLGMRGGTIDDVLKKNGMSRKVVLSVPSFSMVSPELLRSDRITTVPSTALSTMQNTDSFRVKQLPFSTQPIDYHMIWHPRFDNDHRLSWVKAAIGRIAARISTSTDPYQNAERNTAKVSQHPKG